MFHVKQVGLKQTKSPGAVPRETTGTHSPHPTTRTVQPMVSASLAPASKNSEPFQRTKHSDRHQAGNDDAGRRGSLELPDVLRSDGPEAAICRAGTGYPDSAARRLSDETRADVFVVAMQHIAPTADIETTRNSQGCTKQISTAWRETPYCMPAYRETTWPVSLARRQRAPYAAALPGSGLAPK
jgi:hypothetical protein